MILIQFTGLSGSGKTTLAKNTANLLSTRGHEVEIIDGDSYRKTLCKDLGFSKEDRYENIRRLFKVGQDFVQSNVIVLMSVINPYEDLRNELSQFDFVRTVFLDCSIDNLIKRDPKGLYKKALLPDNDENKIHNFTGISAVYETPIKADLTLKTDSEPELISTNKLYSFILDSISHVAYKHQLYNKNKNLSMENSNHPLLHWIPYKMVNKDGELYFEWVYLGDQRYVDPFFEDSIANCKSHPYNSKRVKVVSTVDNLIEWSAELASTNLKAFVFHISRCGSTMLAQSLAVSGQNVVVSEAPIIDEILRSEFFDLEKKRILIKAIIALLGQKRFPEEKDMIIKLDSWHIFEAEELRNIFPDLPFILLYRNPIEVLKSHLKFKGMHMVPKVLPASVFGIEEQELKNMNIKQYGVCVLEKYFEAYLHMESKLGNISIFNYNEGMRTILEKSIAIVDSDYYIEEIDQMYERLNKHSKNEQNVFKGDSFSDEDLNMEITQLNVLYKRLDQMLLEELAEQN